MKLSLGEKPLPSWLWDVKRARTAFRVMVSATAAVAFIYIPALRNTGNIGIQATYIMMTIIAVQDPTAVETICKSGQRLVGTVVGGFAGFALGYGLRDGKQGSTDMYLNFLVLEACLFILYGCLYGNPKLKQYNYAIRIGGATFALVYFTLYVGNNPRIALIRGLSIGLAVFVNVVVSLAVFPASVEDEINDLVASSCKTLAGNLRLIASYAEPSNGGDNGGGGSTDSSRGGGGGRGGGGESGGVGGEGGVVIGENVPPGSLKYLLAAPPKLVLESANKHDLPRPAIAGSLKPISFAPEGNAEAKDAQEETPPIAAELAAIPEEPAPVLGSPGGKTACRDPKRATAEELNQDASATPAEIERYDFRTDTVIQKTSEVNSKLADRGTVLVKNATVEWWLRRVPYWKRPALSPGVLPAATGGEQTLSSERLDSGAQRRPLRLRRCPAKNYGAVLRDLRRVATASGMTNPYLRKEVFHEQWGDALLGHVATILGAVAGILEALEEAFRTRCSARPAELFRELQELHSRHLLAAAANAASSLKAIQAAPGLVGAWHQAGCDDYNSRNGDKPVIPGGQLQTHLTLSMPSLMRIDSSLLGRVSDYEISGVSCFAGGGDQAYGATAGEESKQQNISQGGEEIPRIPSRRRLFEPEAALRLRGALSGIAAMELVLRLLLRTERLIKDVYDLEQADVPIEEPVPDGGRAGHAMEPKAAPAGSLTGEQAL